MYEMTSFVRSTVSGGTGSTDQICILWSASASILETRAIPSDFEPENNGAIRLPISELKR